jgi:hypothetical protein
MKRQSPDKPPRARELRPESAPRPSPQTDPTNPYRQESAGEWTRAEEENERRQDEPGLTDEDRQQRGSA